MDKEYKMVRKTTEGPIRNKEKTRLKLLNAVGEIIRTEGYKGLGVNNIATKAKADKKLIYLYFESVDKLVEAYVRQKDYWETFSEGIQILIEEHKGNFGKDLASKILVDQFNFFLQAEEMQKVILWEISEKNELMREIADARETLGNELFKLTDPQFENTNVDIRAIQALLIGGIYYLVLHAKSNGSTFCGIDINEQTGQQRIINSLKQVVEWTYNEAKNQKKDL
ncbi:AcrR family transcriptional regulator [Pedobacter cryoconitis]|uniref:AcrR family transcriptional regulator n=1 Tax=Pedobacter cryoconitis TaxID=188932 RepID=A0A7W8ZP52_9SPHI|nr:TetR/AcrR family transcriptional regulator [Pedobacter cryoconitis]MBB5637594.1 AcrR family transcriptional regulator [Pedobacter cryoconitis]MBB6270021.1 AcrR family transcriptional regulator [Pedobacter cryoconitis]